MTGTVAGEMPEIDETIFRSDTSNFTQSRSKTILGHSCGRNVKGKSTKMIINLEAEKVPRTEIDDFLFRFPHFSTFNDAEDGKE